MRAKRPAALHGSAVLLAAVGISVISAPAAAPRDVRLAIEGHANATPWIAARGDLVAVAWGAGSPRDGGDVYAAVSRDGGGSFGQPVRVNAAPGTARLGGELPPRVALGPAAASGDPEITVAWNAKASGTEIRAARSRDGGRTFVAHQALSAPGAAGDRGWQALTIDPRGAAHVLWLDHRGLATMPKADHDHTDGAAMARFSGLYYSPVSDRADPAPATPSERELAAGVCYCCKVAMAADAEGSIYAAWRHVYPGNLRDIAFLLSRDGGRTFTAPVRVSEDRWQLAGCPDDGPAMAVAADQTVHVVWPTVIGGETPEGALFHAATRDGRTFTTRRRIPTRGGPRPMHPQVVVDADGSLVVAWDEVIDGVRQAAARRVAVDRAGESALGPIVRIGEGATSYPVLARTSSGVLVAGTHGSGAQSVVVVGPLRAP